jgi:hypothetical protein
MFTHDQILEISKENDDMRERLGAVGTLLDELLKRLKEGYSYLGCDIADDMYKVIHQPHEKWPKIKGWE